MSAKNKDNKNRWRNITVILLMLLKYTKKKIILKENMKKSS